MAGCSASTRGIGATSAVFSMADALILRPLPVADPGALLSLRSEVKDAPFGANYYSTSYPDYRDYREESHSFDGLAAFEYTTASFVPEVKAPPQLRMGVLASGNLFSLLGVEPTLGRGFRPEEDEVSGRDAVVVLSHELWTSAFGADPLVVGRTIRLNGAAFTVIGVAPSRFTGVDQYVRPAFFVPLHAAPLLEGEAGTTRLEKRDDRRLAVKGRLRRGVSPAQAQAELTTLAGALQSAYPDTNRNQSVRLRSELQARIAACGDAGRWWSPRSRSPSSSCRWPRAWSRASPASSPPFQCRDCRCPSAPDGRGSRGLP